MILKNYPTRGRNEVILELHSFDWIVLFIFISQGHENVSSSPDLVTLKISSFYLRLKALIFFFDNEPMAHHFHLQELKNIIST